MSLEVLASERYGSNCEQDYHYNARDDGRLVAMRQTQHGSTLVGVKQLFKNVFLPQGYPGSVSEDYVEYQLWDTLQAFCSSITGMLATRAVLKGYGVGDESATVTAATLTWMLKDGMGMVGRIAFAWMKGTQLDCDAKRWRLFADVLNDFAILLDLVAPLFKSYFIFIVCISSVARSIVGVAGGATRAALTLHQARRDNMADVSAKDGSQETLVNLMALVAGFMITPLVSNNQWLVWFLFFLFTFLHLLANYCAVSCVIMETVNLPRLHLLINHYLKTREMLNPRQVAKLDPVLKSPGYKSSIHVGSSLGSVIKGYGELKYVVDSESITDMYVVGYDKKQRLLNIVVHVDATERDIMKGCFYALLLDMLISKTKLETCAEFEKHLSPVYPAQGEDYSFPWRYNEMEKLVRDIYPTFEKELTSKGWQHKICHLGVDEWRTSWNKKSK